MTQPGIPKARAQAFILGIEQALIAGHKPKGVPINNTEKSAIRAAGEAMTPPVNRESLHSTLRGSIRVFGREPDWSLYRPPEAPTPTFERIHAKAAKPRVVVQAGTPDGRPYRVLAIGDAHDAPTIPKDRFRWIGRHAKETQPDWIVSIGDFLTLDSLNSHIPNENLSGRAKPAYLADIASGKEALETMENEIQKAAGYKPRKHITLGNHERRVYLFEDSAPEVAGMMQHELESIFDAHQWGRTPYGQYLFLAGVGFTHCAVNRLNKSYGGKNAEMTIANDAVFDHVIGHSHVRREHRAPKLGPSQHVTVLNLGCALPWGHVEPYMYHGATTGWSWGINDLTIRAGHIVDAGFLSMIEMERRYG